MMPGGYRLKDLPPHLKRYAATVVALPPADEKCMTCWRIFNTVDDASDHNERPCQALRLRPCGHLIGSQCFEELLRRDFTTCPSCTQGIAMVPAQVPRWITFLLEHDDFSFSPSSWLRVARVRAMSKGAEALRHFDIQHALLFQGNLAMAGGVDLWLHYMVWPFLTTTWAMAAAFLMNSIMHSIELRLEKLPKAWVFPKYLTSIMGTDVGYIVPVVNAVVFLCLGILLRRLDRKERNDIPWAGRTLQALAVRNLTRLVPLKVFLLCLTSYFWIFAVMVGILIGMGVGKKKYY